MGTQRVHKVAKGDTLSSIAKRHGHARWQDIWNAPPNKGLAAKRRLPEDIRPGDELVIPLTPAETKAAQLTAASANAALSVELHLQAALQREIQQIDRRIAICQNAAADATRTHEQVNAILRVALEERLLDAGFADGMKLIVDSKVKTVTLVVKYKKSLAMAAEELAKFNKDLMKGVQLGLAVAGINLVATFAQNLRDDDNAAIAGLGILGDSWLKISAPSYWGQVVTNLRNGKDWSSAIATDVGDDIREKFTEADNALVAAQKRHYGAIARYVGHKRTAQALLDQSKRRSAKLQAQLAAAA